MRRAGSGQSPAPVLHEGFFLLFSTQGMEAYPICNGSAAKHATACCTFCFQQYQVMLACGDILVSHMFVSQLCNITYQGRYVKWDVILKHFGNDLQKATQMIQQRRTQHKGVSRDRNDNSETFLLFDDQEREWTSTTIEP